MSNTKTDTAKHLDSIDSLAANYASQRDQLTRLQQGYKTDVEAVRGKYRSQMKRFLKKAIALKAKILAAIDERRDCFAKPKSKTMHGIKLGLRKKKGKIVWPKGSEAKVVALIRKHFPEKADVLVDQVETPSKTALNNLSVGDLKKIGVSVISDTDEAFVKDAASDLDNLIEQLLGDEQEDQK